MASYNAFSKSNSISPGHEDNQDSLLADGVNLVFAVADGVGGYRGGKEASEIAIETLRKYAANISDEDAMEEALEEMHERVRKRARQLRYANMGTTIAAVKVMAQEGKMITGNVGDSPILCLPSGEEISSFNYAFTDDSHRDSDPSAMFGITQYIGLETKIDFHSRSMPCSQGDIILICSDGVTDNLLNPGVRGGKRLPEIARRYRSAERIVEHALEAGVKKDDMTAVLVTI